MPLWYNLTDMEPRQQEQLAPIGEIQPTASQYEVGAAQNSPEVAQSGVENHREIGSVRAEAVQAAMAAAPALPTPVLSAQSDNNAGVADDTTVMLANDDDLIEKEWVDKAKKILAETKDDPYRREYEISKLQIEYIRQRYGRVIGQAED